jgi:SAM-dependent methyltransferase
MKVTSKAWDWNRTTDEIWLKPSEESYYVLDRWKNMGYMNFLDLGCGRGRHSIQFAKADFNVYAFDLSEIAISEVLTWAEREKVSVIAKQGDMLALPYKDSQFDCLFSYNVISHTDTIGIKRIISELKRVLRSGGEFYLTLCSKEMWSFKDASFPIIDENTVLRKEDGPENDIPHFFADENLIRELFVDFQLISVRLVKEIVLFGSDYVSWHYFIHGATK